jgi:hypothetical protein
MTNHQCPQCGTNDIYRIDTYCAGHQQIGKSGTLAVLPTGGGYYGLGTATTTSRSQSKLAAGLTPGEYPYPSIVGTVITLTIGVLVTLCAFAASVWAGIGCLSLTLTFAFFLSQDSTLEQRRGIWNEKTRLYEHGWVCVRCGSTWIPEGVNPR